MKNNTNRITTPKAKRTAAATVSIRGDLTWTWSRTKRGNYVAVCEPIGQTVQAEEFGELLETIGEALGSTFTELLSTGDFETFLREHGWSCAQPPPSPVQKNIRFDIPFDLKGVQRRDFQEALCQ
jgi:hypothetical protein